MYTDIRLRLKIIEMYLAGKTQRHIAELLNVSPATVNYWINRNGSIETRKRTGRKRKTTQATDDAIFLMSQANPFMPTTEIIYNLQLPIGKHAVIQRLKKYGLASYRPAKKEHLSADHIRQRLKFAIEHRDWTIEQWKKVIFSDEKSFSTFGKGFNRVWRTKRQNRYDNKYINITRHSGRQTIPVWGCISGTPGNHHIYYIRHGKLNSQKYVPILRTYISNIDTNNLIFMHDQSPIHKAEIVEDFLDEKGIDRLIWPANGPDLNPIENVWAEMERQNRTRSIPRIEDLWKVVEATFKRMENSNYITKLIESMPERCKRVIEANGRWTKY